MIDGKLCFKKHLGFAQLKVTNTSSSLARMAFDKSTCDRQTDGKQNRRGEGER